MQTIPNHRVPDNTVNSNSPRWITWGAGRRQPHSWGTVYAMMIDHGYGFIRIGSVLVGFPADTQEGNA